MQEDRAVDYYLERFFRRYEYSDFVSEMRVERLYHALVGDIISRLTQKITFKKGTLRVKVASAALKHELTMRRESLRTSMNDNLGAEVVQKIVVA